MGRVWALDVAIGALGTGTLGVIVSIGRVRVIGLGGQSHANPTPILVRTLGARSWKAQQLL